MASITIQGGTFNELEHCYRDDGGQWVPSVTQVLKLTGLSSYSSAISEEVMAAAADRGSKVHAICWSLAKYGDYDPSWSTEELDGYVAAYNRFVSETGFIPDPNFCESPMIAEVHGMKFGVTPDALGSRGKHAHVVELKTVATVQRAWRFQTAAQEFARFSTAHCGRAVRMAVQLFKDGRYKIDRHEQHSYDGHVFISALTVVHERLLQGHKLWE